MSDYRTGSTTVVVVVVYIVVITLSVSVVSDAPAATFLLQCSSRFAIF